jgi:hypothetical protein
MQLLDDGLDLGRVGLFRDPPEIKSVIEELHRAQAEANLQCR